MAQVAKSNDPLTPKYRYALKARIVEVGYKSLTDFSKALDTDLPKISRIVSGWELPSHNLQNKMAETLGITVRELKGFLDG